jgi:hypothetical protein
MPCIKSTGAEVTLFSLSFDDRLRPLGVVVCVDEE